MMSAGKFIEAGPVVKRTADDVEYFMTATSHYRDPWNPTEGDPVTDTFKK